MKDYKPFDWLHSGLCENLGFQPEIEDVIRIAIACEGVNFKKIKLHHKKAKALNYTVNSSKMGQLDITYDF